MIGKHQVEAAADIVERRIIRVDRMDDQAGIAAALRRAFAAGPQQAEVDPFADLLRQLQ